MSQFVYNYEACKDFNSKLKSHVRHVHLLLRSHVGRMRALKGKVIRYEVPRIDDKIISPDNLCDIIELLRRHRIPIVSNSYHGYWMAENLEEYIVFLNRWERRCTRQLSTISEGRKCNRFPEITINADSSILNTKIIRPDVRRRPKQNNSSGQLSIGV